jgi:hypothetical protein
MLLSRLFYLLTGLCIRPKRAACSEKSPVLYLKNIYKGKKTAYDISALV